MDPFAKPAEVERPKFFQSSNGDLVEVTDSIIEACYTIKCLISGHGRMVFKNSLGGAFIYENNRVIHQKEQKIMATLLQNDAERLLIYVHDVRTPILRRLLDFIAYHQQDVTERERKAWNATFIEQCSQILCELASAAYYLDHKPLVNLTSKAIASQISGKSTEELREVLGTQNEPPMPASWTNHLPARFRLQAKMDSKKQKAKLAAQNAAATAPQIEAPPPAPVVEDKRSVEDILAFLGESTSTSKKGKGKGKKGKDIPETKSKASEAATESASTPNINTSKGGEEIKKEETDAAAAESGHEENESHSPPASEVLPTSRNEKKLPAKNGSETKTQQHKTTAQEKKAATKTTPSATASPARSQTNKAHADSNKAAQEVRVEATAADSGHLRTAPEASGKALNLSASSSTSTSTATSSSCLVCSGPCQCDNPAHHELDHPSPPTLSHLTFPSSLPATSPAHPSTRAISNNLSSNLPFGLPFAQQQATSPFIQQSHNGFGAHPQQPTHSSAVAVSGHLPPFALSQQQQMGMVGVPSPSMDLPPGLLFATEASSTGSGASYGFQQPASITTPSNLYDGVSPYGTGVPSTQLFGTSIAYDDPTNISALLTPGSKFAQETSDFPLDGFATFSPFGTSTPAATTTDPFWKEEDDATLDADFEKELEQFRQSMEIRTSSSSLRSSSSLHGSGGHRPVGAC